MKKLMDRRGKQDQTPMVADINGKGGSFVIISTGRMKTQWYRRSDGRTHDEPRRERFVTQRKRD